jgi:hypothetical protein
MTDDTHDLWVWGDFGAWNNLGQIQGPEGPQGPIGPDGGNGTPGINGTDGKGWTAGSYSSVNGIVTFTSDDGLGFTTTDLRGDAATIAVGATSTGLPGTDANVTNQGTSSAAVFNFVIPGGQTGSEGPEGPEGPQGDPGGIGPEGPEGPKGDKGDQGDPGEPFDPTGDYGITGIWTFSNADNTFVGDGSGLTDLPLPDLSTYATKAYSDAGDVTALTDAKAYTDIETATTLIEANTYTDVQISAIPAPDLSSYATKVYSDSGDATTLSSSESYTDNAIANLPPSGVQLDNKDSWTWGQYNVQAVPTKGGSASSVRWDWNPEEEPVVSVSDNSAILMTVFPGAPTVTGMFISITWVSYGNGQVWAWDDTVFNSKLGPPEDNGEDVTRIFHSRYSKWCDVA